MLDSLEIIRDSSGEIIIGMPKGDKELNGKAEGNILGSYGGEPNRKKARDFLGLTQAELSFILKKFPLKDKEKLNSMVDDVLSAEARASKFSDDVADGFDDES